MVAALIHTINEEFGLFTFATMSTYFSIAGAVAQRRAHPVERLRRRKRVLLGVMIVMCVSTVLHREHVIGNHGRRSNPAGRQRHQVRTRIPDHTRTSQWPGFRHDWSPSARRSRGFACAGSPLIRNVIQITFLRFTVCEKPGLIRGSKSSVLQHK